jgi:hypothetical protein
MNPLYANNDMKNKISRGIISILLAITLFILSGCATFNYKQHNEEVKQHMETYLKNRYGIDFEVNPHLFVSTFSSDKECWEADAHPVKQPEIQFKVNDSKGAKYIDYEHSDDDFYSDNYLDAKWSYQAKQEIEKKLREVYGPNVDFNLRKYTFGGGRNLFKDLDFDQVFEKAHGHGVVDIDYDIFMDGAQFDKAVEAKKAYQIVKRFVLDFDSDSCSINIQYIDKASQQDYLSNSKPYTDNWLAQHGSTDYSPKYKEEIKNKKLLNSLRWNRTSHSVDIKNDSTLVKYLG